VVALPSVIYNGKTQLTEPFHGNIVTDFLYEVFVDANATYYGSYRCIKRAPVEWNVLTSLGQGVSTVLRNHEAHPLKKRQVRDILLEPSGSRERSCCSSHRVPGSTHVRDWLPKGRMLGIPKRRLWRGALLRLSLG
jgi:hypothetical protein